LKSGGTPGGVRHTSFLELEARVIDGYAESHPAGGAPEGLSGQFGVVALLFIPAVIVGFPLAGLFNIGGFAFLVHWSLATGYRLYRALVRTPTSVEGHGV